MQYEDTQITINNVSIEVKNLLDLHSHWPEIRARLDQAVSSPEIEDAELKKIVRWLTILGDKTLYRIE